MKWIDIRKQKPAKNIRVLACDNWGFVDIVDTSDVYNIHIGEMSWWQCWNHGNGTDIVAWHPLPPWPKKLCVEEADGSMP